MASDINGAARVKPDGNLRAERAKHCNYEVLNERHQVVAECYGQVDEQVQQRAALFASAPDLLAALEECITDDGAQCLVTSDVAYMIRRFKAINTLARAAIAKARQGGGA